MALSRLRLRLAGAFAITFAVALTVVATASLGWLWYESTRRLDERLAAVAATVVEALRRERIETPREPFATVVDAVQRDWVAGPETWMLVAADGRVLAATATDSLVSRVLRAAPPRTGGERQIFDVTRDGDDVRALWLPLPAAPDRPAITLGVLASTEGIERDTERLALALAVTTPLILLVALGGGYLMARRALAPVEALGDAIDALGPHRLGARVPVNAPADELDRLARRFNALLDRLDAAQAQTRDFVREAAHQIRTPLTLVRGEAEHALAASTSHVDQLSAALRRVQLASAQMDRRVNELFLLAEAEAGGRFDLRELVDVDGLVAETLDLFRARAHELGRTLAFGRMDAATVQGNEALLREALHELVENACRYSVAGSRVTVSVTVASDRVELNVDSVPADATAALTTSGTRLGHRIVHWIAEGHHGGFDAAVQPESGRYRAVLSLPISRPS